MLKKVLLILLASVTLLAAKTIDTIDIKGFDADKLKPLIGINVGDKYSSSKVQKAKMIIKQALGSAGYQKSSVTSKTSDKGKTVGVTFNVAKGNKVTVTKINFIGNKQVASSDLSSKLVNKEAEFMGWFPGRNSGTANVPQLKYDAMRVQDEYFKRGYLDAKVNKPVMKVDPKTSDATITYRIKEGKQYKISKVQLSMGKIVGLERKDAWEMLSLKKGDIFDVSNLRKDIKNVTIKLGDLGYAYAKVVPAFRKNDRKRNMSVQYKIIPGARVIIGDVVIKGNKKTKDRVVRRYVDLAPGDIYNYTTIKESKKSLSRTGYFEKVVITPKKATSKKVNLEVDVKEAKTGAFTLSGGYGSADGWMVGGSVGDKNIFGTGIEGKASIDYSKVTQSYGISFTEPRLLDSKYSLSAGIFKKEHDYSDRDAYQNLAYKKKDELGGYLSLGRQFTNNIYASIGYSYRSVEYDDINTSYAGYAPGDYDNYIKSSIIASLVYDNTDDYYTPREGIYARIGFEYAGLGSAPAGKRLAEFTRYDLKLAGYYGMREQIDYDLIFRAKVRASYIDHDVGKYVPVAERLFLGGASRGVRGFKSGTISPKTGGFRTGGFRSYVLSAEASIPLSEASKMRLTFFADYGQIGVNSFDVTQKSVGAQVEWKSPFGPINLIFAKAIDPDEIHGNTASFEFNIGGKF
ncbi:MAG: outer membrane protein assembly factor BamA [Sulfurovum sp.]|nr:outer membrane protein assembly factor BamA [Sulfurovum sp.]